MTPPSDLSWYASTISVSLRLTSWHPAKNVRSNLGSSTSGVSEPLLLNTCANADPPSRRQPPDRSKSTKSVVSGISVLICGVHVLRTSSTAENAVTIRDNGATTSLSTSSSPGLHFIHIDKIGRSHVSTPF